MLKNNNIEKFIFSNDFDEDFIVDFLKNNPLFLKTLSARNDETENILSTAVYYDLEKVVNFLLNSDLLDEILEIGELHPFYAWRDSMVRYEYSINCWDDNVLLKKYRIFNKLLGCESLDIPEDFLFMVDFRGPLSCQSDKLKRFSTNCLIKIFQNSKVNKRINELLVDMTCLEVIASRRENSEVIDLILKNEKFIDVNKTVVPTAQKFDNNLCQINAATACCHGNKYNIFSINEKNLLRITSDKRFDDLLVLDLLQYLLKYHNYNNHYDFILGKIEKIVPLIIERKGLAKEYPQIYDELIFIAAMYGKFLSFDALIDGAEVPLSPQTYHLIEKYAIEFPLKNKETKEAIKNRLTKVTVETMCIQDELSHHIMMYFTGRYISRSLVNLALDNILKYFKNKELVKNVLENFLEMNDNLPEVNFGVRRNLSVEDQTRDWIEYSMYRCYHQTSEDYLVKFEQAMFLATYLIDTFELNDIYESSELILSLKI